MEENTALVDCLIRYYIDMKHFLKTRILDEYTFLHEMVRHCKECGFPKYSDKEIKNVWKKLLSKYVYLKTKGSTEERESWKYFYVLDSCYEQSDFFDGIQPKFSEDMMWFLIECFFKHKTIGKSQKRNSNLNEIHKEFLLAGYLNVTKHDIENKWKYLNLKYNKLKNHPESLKKLPYLQALKIFNEESKNELVNMVFTKHLTDLLIECFTKAKILCIIHGYDSDKVLSEIQLQFKELGFHFSKEAIRDEWRKLTNVYEFLKEKGREGTSWVYFNAMRDHFKEDYLSLSNIEEKVKRNGTKLRQRSKSVSQISVKGEKICTNKNKSIKRPLEDVEVEKSPKKLKTRGRPRKNVEKNQENVVESKTVITESARSLKRRSKSVCVEIKQKYLDEQSVEPEKLLVDKKRLVKKPKINGRTNNCEEKSKIRENSGGSVSERLSGSFGVVDSSNIEQKDKNSVLDKKISENELLPLKKRSRVKTNSISKQVISKEIKNKGVAFPVTKIKNQFNRSGVESKRLSEKMGEIVEELRRETFGNDKEVDKSDKDAIGVEESYNNLPCSEISKVRDRDVTQNPSTKLVVKMNGSNNFSKCVTNEGNIYKTDGSLKNKNKKIEEITNIVCQNQDVDIVKPNNVNGNIVVETEIIKPESTEDKSPSKSSIVSNNNEILTDSISNMNVQIDDYNSDFYPIESNDCYVLEDSQESVCEIPTSETVFREPLPVVKKPVNKTTSSPKIAEKPLKNNTKFPLSNHQLQSGKLKEIFISPQELNKISKFKPSGRGPVNQNLPRFNFVSQVIKPATVKSVESELHKETDIQIENNGTSRSVDDSHTASQSVPGSSTFVATNNFYESKSSERNDEFENDECTSVISETVGDDGLKDNLLATVIDFQEQNNQEFIEIKNLMKQNNLLQRETNRLLRLLLEKK